MFTQRLIWVDRMRGLAILSVVIQHLTYYYQNDFIYHKLIGISNMAVFFFISGYIWERTAKIDNIKESIFYLGKKAIQIMLPFIVWTFFIYPYCFQIEWQVWNMKSIVCEFSNPHLWFLLTLYGYTFYFVIFKFVNKLGGVKLSICFWIIVIIALGTIFYKFGMFKFATLYIPYFALGTLVASSNGMEKMLSNNLLSTTALVIIFLLTCFWESGHTNLVNIGVKILVSLSVIIVTYLICTKLTWNQYWNNFIIKCGKYSLAIYIIHWNFLHIFDEKLMIVQNELVAFIPILLFSILICYTCILFKDIIKIFLFADILLFGNHHVLKK